MSDVDIGHRAPHRHRVRFGLCAVAAVLFALALISDVVSGFLNPRCPPGWTRWDFEPGPAVVLGIPVALLLAVSGVAVLRARREAPISDRGLPIATVCAGVLALLAAVTLFILASNLVDQLTDPTAGCTTF